MPEGVKVSVSGIGLEAARVASEELVAAGCTALVNAGVCGALHRRLERGAVYRISTVITEELPTAINVGVGLGLKRLVSVEEPLCRLERRRELARQNDLVDMEGYAVARTCETHGIPCILLKGVTDFGDVKAKEDIRKHITPVSEALAEAVHHVLEGFAAKSVKKARTSPEAVPGLISRLSSFTKIEHTLFSLPFLFAGAWLGAGGMPPVRTLLLIALAGLGARVFGMALNRIVDREIDAANPRTARRELAAGTLTIRQAYGVAAAGLAAYFAGCVPLGPLVLKLSLFPLVPLALYPFLKRFTPLCHFGIGVVLAVAPIGAFVAASGSLALPPALLLLLLFTFFWISGCDIIYALLDIEFDQAHQVHSLPASLGARGAQAVAALVHLVAFAALVLLWVSTGGETAPFIALLASAAAFGTAYMPDIPIAVRFFPISVIAGMAGALVVPLGGGL